MIRGRRRELGMIQVKLAAQVRLEEKPVSAGYDPRQLDLPGPTNKLAGGRRPGGENVKWSGERLHGDGCAGQGVAEKADGRQDARGGGCGSRHERAQRAPMAEGSVSVAGA